MIRILVSILVLFFNISLYGIEGGRTFSSNLENANSSGKTRIKINFGRPSFDDGSKYYSDYYGEESIYPTVGFDHYFFTPAISIGIGANLGYYVDKGSTSINNPDVTGGDVVINDDQSADLVLTPMQVFLTTRLSPFQNRYVALDLKYGLERCYFQSVRYSDEVSESSSQNYINKGYKDAMVFGASAHLLLNKVEPGTVRTLYHVLGLGAVYLSPFTEVVRQIDKESGVSLGRTTVGIGFTFESIN